MVMDEMFETGDDVGPVQHDNDDSNDYDEYGAFVWYKACKDKICLTDFGLSKEGISLSSSGANSFCGTPEYLAPEILNWQGHGRGVDWWSLGALLYQMLRGLPPFYCQDRECLFEKILKRELHYPASLSSVVWSLN